MNSKKEFQIWWDKVKTAYMLPIKNLSACKIAAEMAWQAREERIEQLTAQLGKCQADFAAATEKWDYYQELVRVFGQDSISQLVVKFSDLRRTVARLEEELKQERSRTTPTTQVHLQFNVTGPEMNKILDYAKAKDSARHWTDTIQPKWIASLKHTAKALETVIQEEIAYCQSYADKYAATDPERSARHSERATRLKLRLERALEDQ